MSYETLYSALTQPTLVEDIDCKSYGKVVISALKDDAVEIKSVGSLILIRLSDLAALHSKFYHMFEDADFIQELTNALKP